MKIKECLSYDDVLLEPKFSIIRSRSDVDLTVKIVHPRTQEEFNFNGPIIPANMSKISSEAMMLEMYKMKHLGLFHRFAPIAEQLKWGNNLKQQHPDAFKYIGFSIGVKDQDRDNLDLLIAMGVKIVCIDIAHADSLLGLEMTEYVAKK